MAAEVVPVNQLSDNYAYLIVNPETKKCAVVDCAEADKVLTEVKARGLELEAVLSTHWHFDHVGGNEDLAKAIKGIKVYGARAENGRVPALTDPVDDRDQITVAGVRGRVIGIPAHTNGHVAYYFPEIKSVFTGDTLFVAGCGRVFEGKAATMVESLGKLAALPDDTRVYCGHEYTEKNLRFALSLEPANQEVKARHQWAVEQNKSRKPTVPSTIGEEKKINPFLRTDSAELRASVKKIDPKIADDRVAIFARIREMKDHF